MTRFLLVSAGAYVLAAFILMNIVLVTIIAGGY